MKKYISLLSIAAVLLMQSCERIDSNYNFGEEFPPHSDIMKKDNSPLNLSCPGQTNTSNVEPGGDDEPDRDKQHWRSGHGQ